MWPPLALQRRARALLRDLLAYLARRDAEAAVRRIELILLILIYGALIAVVVFGVRGY